MPDDTRNHERRVEEGDVPERMTLAKIDNPPSPQGRGWSTASRLPQAPFRYDRKTIVLHWCTAVLVALLWLIAEIIDDFPDGPLRVDARSVHISLGLALAAVLAVRVLWRNRGSGALSPVRAGMMDRAAALGHWLLYALAILAVILGITNALARGDNIFNLFALPDLAHGDRALRKLIGTMHGWAANTLVIVAIGHSLLALFHHYGLRDGLLQRIMPQGWLARQDAPKVPHSSASGQRAKRP
jgi:cytochrome b561